ncbi:hypothetical protein KUTeg_003116 [Tegillarca granosa]|uniref:RUN domain-containing protein n=1 Tax=Tegillarca granosa TaxID=220873 RepID=A0ABQ9FP44_TEGGR|nr:hypothetical protein KUTeg_003116 [Tegillarca granosa]
MNGDDPHSNERQSLLTRLLDAVKQGFLPMFSMGSSFTTWNETTNKVTGITGLNKVADIISDIKGKDTDADLWHYVKEHLTKHEQERFQALKHINCDAGRGRAWLRACLNEHSLERYMHMLIESEDLLSNHYESWAFLRDLEKSTMLPMMAAGLGSILFAIHIDNPDLNTIRRAPPTTIINIPNVTKSPPREDTDPRPVIAGEESPVTTSTDTGKKKDKKKKKKTANIVSFDEDDSGTFSGSQISEHEHRERNRNSFTKQTSVDTSSYTKNEPQDNDSANDIPTFNITNEDISVTSVTGTYNNTVLKSLPFNREPSVTSGNSFDRPPSQNSFSSADFDLSDTGGHMIPVSSGEAVNISIVPVSSESSLYGRSVDSSDSNVFTGEDIQSAKLALAMVQKGTSHSYRTAGDGGNVEQIKTDSMNTDELKQAVVSMMVRKDEVEEQNRNLQAMLQQEMLTSSSLRAEIEEMKQSFILKQEKEQARHQTLQKENDLLKHQLRRYVNAVQMLRAEGSQVDESLGIHLEEPQPNIPPPKQNIDYSHEASEYEKKLIQVAEMHGELMEFNEMLHRQLNGKDALLKRLQQELVDLRGPLPRDMQLTDELSVDSDRDQTSEKAGKNTKAKKKSSASASALSSSPSTEPNLPTQHEYDGL